MAEFKVTVPDPDLDVLDWVLAQQRAADPKSAPADRDALVGVAIEGMILAPWRAQKTAALVVDLQATLDGSAPDVKEAALLALAALKDATPEQRVLALTQLTAGLAKASTPEPGIVAEPA